MNDALMKAVLSMDSYNRTDRIAMNVPSTQLGTYSFLEIALPSNAAAISFSASAYLSTDGSTVISYRGTDGWIPPTDALTGYPIAAGEPFGPQFIAAFEFYRAVANDLATRAENQGPTVDPSAISLTGHSLGGGLAGLVAAIHGKNAEIFANMPFEAAVNNAYQYMIRVDSPETNPDAPFSNPLLQTLAETMRPLIYGGAQPWQPMIGSNLHGYAVAFEALSPFRVLQSTPDDALDPGTLVASLGFGERHSMALHTLLLWEKDNATDVKWWKVVSDNLWDAYSKDTIGTTVGFPQNSQDFASTPGEQLGTAIAYSVINEGARPFGDTAVKALFNDANDFGYAVYQDSSSLLRDDIIQSDIANLTVHYSGLLAKNAVLQSNSPAVIDGVITLDKEAGSLSIDLSDTKWAVNGALTDPFGRSELIDHVVNHSVPTNQLQDALAWYAENSGSTYSGYDLIGSVTFDLQGAVNAIPAINVPSGQLDLIAALQGADAGSRGISDELLLGAKYSDVLLGGDGKDILFGADARDTLNGGNGDDFLNGGSGNDELRGAAGANLLYGGEGADKLVAEGIGDILNGGHGNDIIELNSTSATIEFGSGDGSDVVQFDLAAGDYTLKLTDLNPEDIYFIAGGFDAYASYSDDPVIPDNYYGNLYQFITLSDGAGNQITFLENGLGDDHNLGPTSVSGSGIPPLPQGYNQGWGQGTFYSTCDQGQLDTIIFADGTVWNQAAIWQRIDGLAIEERWAYARDGYPSRAAFDETSFVQHVNETYLQAYSDYLM